MLTQDDLDSHIVCDLGSGTISAGYAGDRAPRAVFPSIVGKNIYTQKMLGMGTKDTFIGDEAVSKCGILKLSSPIKHGRIVNEEQLINILHHMPYNELCLAPEEHPLLVTEHPQNPKENREKLIEILVENFSWPVVYIANPANLFAPYVKNGIIVDCGFGVTTVSPVLDNKVLENEIFRQDFAGSKVTDAIINHLNNEGNSFFNSGERHLVTSTILYPTHRYYGLGKIIEDNTAKYLLPDGKNISFGIESFYAPEILFNPRLINANKFVGIQDMIYKSISNCSIDEQSLLLDNIFLSGASTLFENFPEMLKDKLSQLFPNSKIQINAAKERRFHSWIYGSKFVATQCDHSDWISLDDYNEYGPTVVWGKKEQQTEEIA